MRKPERKDISCVDLFCGAGGLTYGFEQEGLCVECGLDLDPACRYPYVANTRARFRHKNIVYTDIVETAEMFRTGTVRVLAGCAPCQPFSSYSQRYDMQEDCRWVLLYYFTRLAMGILPDIVTMENVPGLRNATIFADLLTALERAGYHVWYDVVDCEPYGVPQTRKRLVLLASLHGPIELEPPPGVRRTVRDVIGKLRPLQAGEADPEDRLHAAAKLSPRNLERIRASRPGGTWRDWPPRLQALCHRAPTGRSYPGVYGRMEWDRPAPTITTQCYNYGSGRFGHPEQDRAISLREAALLQGFPPDYEFVPPGEKVRFTVVGRLIGNAVPVDLARTLARSIIRHVDRYQIKPDPKEAHLCPA